MQLSIGFISQDWSQVENIKFPNGCTWYRCVLPAHILRSLNHVSHVGTLAFSQEQGIGVRVDPPLYPKSGIYSGHDIISLKLPMHISNVHAVEHAIEHGKKVVVDIDDWFDDLPKSNRAYQQTDPEIHKDNNRDNYFKIIEMSHALICSTPFLRDAYSAKHPNKPVFMVRNSIDTARWPVKKQRRKSPTIGWVGATPWRANDLEQISGFINEYMKKYNLDFHHSGHIEKTDSAAELLQLNGVRVTTSPMAPITDLPSLFTSIDIGIVPLNNIPFNHAKSYLKGLEYAMAGVPFIASYSPEYEYLAEQGIGRIAKTEEEWIYHLTELNSYDMRADEAEFNRDVLLDKFSIDKFAHQWEDTYKMIMDIK